MIKSGAYRTITVAPEILIADLLIASHMLHCKVFCDPNRVCMACILVDLTIMVEIFGNFQNQILAL